ncbi:hypothetical protein [Halorubrum vacuolatum]|uniref:hypothetical protein n=1 Tax=Halorubrum vacuolatum TaxID=63740 RepID=UPI00117A6C11|nr:hypothetical protein [Halorubrum vacuolatum]
MVLLVLGFGYFVVELYETPDSEYVESISQGEVTEQLHIRFVSDTDKRTEVGGYGVVTEDRNLYEFNSMDARLPRQSIDYPPDEDTVIFVLWDVDGEVMETHEVDL